MLKRWGTGSAVPGDFLEYPLKTMSAMTLSLIAESPMRILAMAIAQVFSRAGAQTPVSLAR